MFEICIWSGIIWKVKTNNNCNEKTIYVDLIGFLAYI